MRGRLHRRRVRRAGLGPGRSRHAGRPGPLAGRHWAAHGCRAAPRRWWSSSGRWRRWSPPPTSTVPASGAVGAAPRTARPISVQLERWAARAAPFQRVERALTDMKRSAVSAGLRVGLVGSSPRLARRRCVRCPATWRRCRTGSTSCPETTPGATLCRADGVDGGGPVGVPASGAGAHRGGPPRFPAALREIGWMLEERCGSAALRPAPQDTRAPSGAVRARGLERALERQLARDGRQGGLQGRLAWGACRQDGSAMPR